MRSRLWRWIVPAFLILVAPGLQAAQSRPEITSLDTQFLDNKVNINIRWQSPYPVVLVTVLVGQDQKELKVDEYDNRRNPRGYTGEATVVLNAQPTPGMDSVNYVVYLEDELKSKSEQRTGRVRIPQPTALAQADQPPPPGMPSVQVGVQVGMPGAPMPPPGMPGQPPPPGVQVGVQVGPQPGYPGIQPGMPGGPPPSGPSGQVLLAPAPGGMLDKVRGVMAAVDAPPYFGEIKVNRFEGNNVTISGRAVDDKGLREITFRIFDGAGNKVQEQTLTNLGRIWQGTTNPFNLPPGKYKMIAKAVDNGGNSSAERTADFEVTGQPGQVVVPAEVVAAPMPADPFQPAPIAPAMPADPAQPAPAPDPAAAPGFSTAPLPPATAPPGQPQQP